MHPAAYIIATLDALLHEPRSTVLFIGAGTGIPAPTGLPGGADISNHLLYHLCYGIPGGLNACFGTDTPRLGSAPVPLLAPLNNIARKYNLDYLVASCIRFETLLYSGWLKLGDRFLDVLDCLHCGQPNAYQIYAARLLELGGTVLTTNFDTHIEDSLSPLASVFINHDWPRKNVVGNGALFKIHGSLSTSSAPSYKSALGATLRRVMAPPRDGQTVLRMILESAERVVFIGYSFSDHFDITPVLRVTAFRNPPIVFEYGECTPRLDPRSHLSRKLAHLLPTQRPQVYLCDPYIFFAAHCPPIRKRTSGLSALEKLASLVKAVPPWRRAQILAELLIFLGYYKKAAMLIDACKPPAGSPPEELARYSILAADVSSDARTPDSIRYLVEGKRHLQHMPLDFNHRLLWAQLETTLARERLRHRQRIRSMIGYTVLGVRAAALERSAKTEDERIRVSELRQVIGSYARLAFGKLMWKTIRHFIRSAPQSPSVLPPDVALVELLGSPPSSHTDLVSTRLVFALELMNIVAAYMILRDSERILDVQQAVQLADALGSVIGGVSSRLALSHYHLRRGSLYNAVMAIEEATCLAQKLGRRVYIHFLAAQWLWRWLAGKEDVTMPAYQYNLRLNAARLLFYILLVDNVR